VAAVSNSDPAPSVAAFADLVSRPEEDIDLASAAIAIALVDYPDIDVATERAALADLARRAERECGSHASDEGPEAVCEYVFGELGFRGNREDYYDPRNSYLNEVLARRTGIPISLAVVYLEIASACGRQTEAVGFPGNFLVRDRASGRLLDPFNAGSEVTAADCARLLKKYGIPASQWKDDALAAVGTRAVLKRMIANLLRIYTERDSERHVSELRAMVDVLERARVETMPNLQ
jgi:regulator of sirC expression with transglutaminase-like and TPR domain